MQVCVWLITALQKTFFITITVDSALLGHQLSRAAILSDQLGQKWNHTVFTLPFWLYNQLMFMTHTKSQLLYMYGLLLEGVRTICTFSVDTEWLSKLLAPLATEVGHPTPQLVPSGTYK